MTSVGPLAEQPDLGFGVVILAAGASSRMGRPKLLLPWGESSILGHLIARWQWLETEQIVVVCADGDRAMHVELDRLHFPGANRVGNASPERGMFSSIQCAARWTGWKPQLTHFVIVLGDQPHLRHSTLQALLAFAAANPDKLCQPGRQGRRRHPVVLPGPVFCRLGDAPDATLKEFLQRLSADIAVCELDDPGLDFDLDTPEDYDRAIAYCFHRLAP